MGKVEDMRALREQMRAGRARAGEDLPSAPAAAGRRPPTVAVRRTDDDRTGSGRAAAPAPDAMCGHRSIGNKSCIRPLGHAEKNHRYAKTPGR